MTSPTSATPCGPSEYAPQFNRLGKCLRCQSGLQEPPNSIYTASQRDAKRAVCSEWLSLLSGCSSRRQAGVLDMRNLAAAQQQW